MVESAMFGLILGFLGVLSLSGMVSGLFMMRLV